MSILQTTKSGRTFAIEEPGWSNCPKSTSAWRSKLFHDDLPLVLEETDVAPVFIRLDSPLDWLCISNIGQGGWQFTSTNILIRAQKFLILLSHLRSSLVQITSWKAVVFLTIT
jgi:hypothetical protein